MVRVHNPKNGIVQAQPQQPLSTPTPAPTSIPNQPPNDSSVPPLPTPTGGTKKKAKETLAVWDFWKKVKRDESSGP